MAMSFTTITEISNKRPNDTWLQKKLSELEAEMAVINADRNRLILELSRARNEIYQLLAGIQGKNGAASEQQP